MSTYFLLKYDRLCKKCWNERARECVFCGNAFASSNLGSWGGHDFYIIRNKDFYNKLINQKNDEYPHKSELINNAIRCNVCSDCHKKTNIKEWSLYSFKIMDCWSDMAHEWIYKDLYNAEDPEIARLTASIIPPLPKKEKDLAVTA